MSEDKNAGQEDKPKVSGRSRNKWSGNKYLGLIKKYVKNKKKSYTYKYIKLAKFVKKVLFIKNHFIKKKKNNSLGISYR